MTKCSHFISIEKGPGWISFQYHYIWQNMKWINFQWRCPFEKWTIQNINIWLVNPETILLCPLNFLGLWSLCKFMRKWAILKLFYSLIKYEFKDTIKIIQNTGHILMNYLNIQSYIFSLQKLLLLLWERWGPRRSSWGGKII